MSWIRKLFHIEQTYKKSANNNEKTKTVPEPKNDILELQQTHTTPADDVNRKTGLDTILIGNYEYKLPSWWDSVLVDVPEDLKDHRQVCDFVKKKYGSEMGGMVRWKEALKTYAIAYRRAHGFPVYLAHCHLHGKEFAVAAKIYGDLYEIANTQGSDEDWYRCYLSYSAAETYKLLKDFDKAAVWYARSAEYIWTTNQDIVYYAEKSVNALKKLKSDMNLCQDVPDEESNRQHKGPWPQIAELQALLTEAHSWGRAHSWPHHDEYPQRKRVREIGVEIDKVSGFKGMQRVAYHVDAENSDLTSHLTQFWHGIGSWLA